MRGLILLAALLGLAAGEGSRRAFGANYAAARIDSQEVRIAQLAKQIANLANRIDDDDDQHYNQAVGELERRIEQLEGDDCGEHQFSCGHKSGQCISDLLVCDHAHDCKNDHDEDEAHVCVNQAPAGRSWSGRANWNGCIDRKYNDMSIIITGNRRLSHFPSRIWVDAVIIDKYTYDHEEHTNTWNCHGYYDFAHRRLVLDSPDESEKGIGTICDDAGEGVADCKMIRESDGYQCGHAVLSRAV